MKKIIFIASSLAVLLTGCSAVRAATLEPTRFPTATENPTYTPGPDLLEMLKLVDTNTPTPSPITPTSTEEIISTATQIVIVETASNTETPSQTPSTAPNNTAIKIPATATRINTATKGHTKTPTMFATLKINTATPFTIAVIPSNTATPIPNTATTAPSTATTAPPTATTVPPTATTIPQQSFTNGTLAPNAWKQLPVVPIQLSSKMKEVYQRGLAAGRDPRKFSKIGDCQNVDSYFLSAFDNPKDYSLGQYSSLKPTIDHYAGSWSRKSLAVKGGMNVASVLSPVWADKSACGKNETPLACEIRAHNPSVVIISMETWWGQKPAEVYNTYMRKVIEAALAENVIPVIATKADNLEGNHQINAVIAQIANDYEIPLWNFWAAVQPLPNHGLTEDGFHLTFARNFFDDPLRMGTAWPWRNLTALQTLDAVRNGLITP